MAARNLAASHPCNGNALRHGLYSPRVLDARAREIVDGPLVEALDLTALIAMKDPCRRSRVAARWLQRLSEEHAFVTIEEWRSRQRRLPHCAAQHTTKLCSLFEPWPSGALAALGVGA
jgi:hypothetical protein